MKINNTNYKFQLHALAKHRGVERRILPLFLMLRYLQCQLRSSYANMSGRIIFSDKLGEDGAVAETLD